MRKYVLQQSCPETKHIKKLMRELMSEWINMDGRTIKKVVDDVVVRKQRHERKPGAATREQVRSEVLRRKQAECFEAKCSPRLIREKARRHGRILTR